MSQTGPAVFWTILAGVSVYVLGQIVIRWFVDPIHALHSLIGEILETLIRERSLLTTGRHVELAPEHYDAARDDLRRKSSLLVVRMFLVPRFEWFAKISIVPTRDEILSASVGLRGLANTVRAVAEPGDSEKVEKRVRAIGVALGYTDLWKD